MCIVPVSFSPEWETIPEICRRTGADPVQVVEAIRSEHPKTIVCRFFSSSGVTLTQWKKRGEA